jgi:hypothetical protein
MMMMMMNLQMLHQQPEIVCNPVEEVIEVDESPWVAFGTIITRRVQELVQEIEEVLAWIVKWLVV